MFFFSSIYLFIYFNADLERKDNLLIYQSVINPPHYQVVIGSEMINLPKVILFSSVVFVFFVLFLFSWLSFCFIVQNISISTLQIISMYVFAMRGFLCCFFTFGFCLFVVEYNYYCIYNIYEQTSFGNNWLMLYKCIQIYYFVIYYYQGL